MPPSGFDCSLTHESQTIELGAGNVWHVGLGSMPILPETVSIEESIECPPADAEETSGTLLVAMSGLQHFEHLFLLECLEGAGKHF